MDDSADRFLELIHQLEDFTHSISPDQAHSEFDETTLQLFWMRWPQLSAWAGSLWRLLSEEGATGSVNGPRVGSSVIGPHSGDGPDLRQGAVSVTFEGRHGHARSTSAP